MKKIIASLNDIANELDNTGLYNEANTITKIMHKLAKFDDWDDGHNDDIDDARCPDCGSYDVDTDKDGEPTKCLDCDWSKKNKKEKNNE